MLQIICATLLTAEEVTVHNIPDILDVNNLIQLMRDMGVNVSLIHSLPYAPLQAEHAQIIY